MTRTALNLVHEIFQQLRWRRFPLGAPDLAALRSALAAGFGWSSSEAFRELLVALWAKSAREAEIIRSLFARLPWPEAWTGARIASQSAPPPGAVVQPQPHDAHPSAADPPEPARPESTALPPPATQGTGSLPPLTLPGIDASDARLILVEQYPLSNREVAQAMRRLRRPLRIGPPVELDINATIQHTANAGIGLPPILVPARRNTSRLLMLLDVEGSMVPYMPFVRLFCESVLEAGWLQQVHTYYFHDLPTDSADRSVLLDLDELQLHPQLDPILARIEPSSAGVVFEDETLTVPVQLPARFQTLPTETVALIVSDAGAARGRTDASRLVDTLSFIKSLRTKVRAFVWLNPVPQPLWAATNAAQLSRHIPMFPLDRRGLELAVNVLRGQPARLERPL
jgi:uncharacterized protein with von Willebrand factor type A (vWA) domain